MAGHDGGIDHAAFPGEILGGKTGTVEDAVIRLVPGLNATHDVFFGNGCFVTSAGKVAALHERLLRLCARTATR